MNIDKDYEKNITIDCRMFDAAGIGTYLKNVLPEIIQDSPNYSFTLLINKSDSNNSFFPNFPNASPLIVNAPIYSIREQFELLNKIPPTTHLFWSPHFNIPIFYRGKLLVTIHDVYHMAFFNKLNLPQKLYTKLFFSKIRTKAELIICDSNFTKGELLKYQEINPDRIHTIHLGVDPFWFDTQAQTQLTEKPYFLFVGNIKPHKNLKTLLKAFERIMDRIPHNLILIGKDSGFITEDKEVKLIAKSLGDRIIFKGKVNNNELRRFYQNAEAFIFPSLYEGFGLPAIEAMASRCPVLASHAGSLPEICGDAAIYFNPLEPSDIADKIMDFVKNNSVKGRLIEQGLNVAKNFTWQEAGRRTLNSIKLLLGNN